jgi:hypothetical protein
VRRRLAVTAALSAVLLCGSAGSAVQAAQAGRAAGDGGHGPVRVVHVEMRCHTIGDHEAIS